MPETTSFSEQPPAQSLGPQLQSVVPPGVHGLGNSIPISGNILSNLISTDGYKFIGVGAKLTQAGGLSLQRYLDDAGTIPQGAAVTQALTANTFANLNVTDGLPFASFTLTISNSSGSVIATVSNLIILLQAG